MENPFKKMFGVSQEQSVGVEAEEKRNKLNGVKKRLDDLNAWQNSWTVEDRQLADRLESQIKQLEQESAQ
ncbi:MAG: hypothetical protein A2817_02555 [Candidatus Yanofskybacteria bacterium RIFCSPHIGHO2_01_FULL_39_8b]|uniref:Uncharacterized protein n=1 Tax=Candidatus Yanofskybacteria bacterium RIFCSPHIGHO2_01_FULL_39_8b TaxID=1802659 RepID=A0A1F8EFV1_9BACT|nr:MAG: hypothetical protein A2817_02555 [Candidatus Yanofskybacteria bacterium RIFCSPHIGHO2_01_FULL_39_8b]